MTCFSISKFTAEGKLFRFLFGIDNKCVKVNTRRVRWVCSDLIQVNSLTTVNVFGSILQEIVNAQFVMFHVVKGTIGRRSQVADGHLGRAQMSNEASHWSFRPRLNGPPWSQMASKS